MKRRRFLRKKMHPAESERNGRAEVEGGQEEEREAMIEKERGEHSGMLDGMVVGGAAEDALLPHPIISRTDHCAQRLRPS